MKLRDISSPGFDKSQWEEKGYVLPRFDIAAVKEKTYAAPTWVHFGAGNIFRAFPAACLQTALEQGLTDRGVVVAETFDYEIIDRACRPFDNASLLVVLKADGTVEKRVLSSITESLKADAQFESDWARLEEIFQNPSLQMASFTITEKGYGAPEADIARGLTPQTAMGKVALLLLARFMAGGHPITLQSMDNCAHNGDVLRAAVVAYVQSWVDKSLVPAEFLAYVLDETKVSYPWSMIDKITPRPDAQVQEMLQADGFEDGEIIVTQKGSYTAAFINAEETEYLVLEDQYVAGHPPIDAGGVIFASRETVDKVEKMKVCTCLNPLHTALAIFGCLLGYDRISQQMKDEDLVGLITKMGYMEAMPVVVDPGVIEPGDFIDAVINKRLPNPFMPDAPQRIATDTSQKLSIRFGETIKAYTAQGLDLADLQLICLTLAAYARYLKGIGDDGEPFVLSPDPKLEELCAIVAPLEVKEGAQDMSCLKALYSRADVFGLDLYQAGLGERIEAFAAQLFAGPGAVRRTLHEHVSKR